MFNEHTLARQSMPRRDEPTMVEIYQHLSKKKRQERFDDPNTDKPQQITFAQMQRNAQDRHNESFYGNK